MERFHSLQDGTWVGILMANIISLIITQNKPHGLIPETGESVGYMIEFVDQFLSLLLGIYI